MMRLFLPAKKAAIRALFDIIAPMKAFIAAGVHLPLELKLKCQTTKPKKNISFNISTMLLILSA